MEYLSLSGSSLYKFFYDCSLKFEGYIRRRNRVHKHISERICHQKTNVTFSHFSYFRDLFIKCEFDQHEDLICLQLMVVPTLGRNLNFVFFCPKRDFK